MATPTASTSITVTAYTWQQHRLSDAAVFLKNHEASHTKKHHHHHHHHHHHVPEGLGVFPVP